MCSLPTLSYIYIKSYCFIYNYQEPKTNISHKHNHILWTLYHRRRNTRINSFSFFPPCIHNPHTSCHSIYNNALIILTQKLILFIILFKSAWFWLYPYQRDIFSITHACFYDRFEESSKVFLTNFVLSMTLEEQGANGMYQSMVITALFVLEPFSWNKLRLIFNKNYYHLSRMVVIRPMLHGIVIKKWLCVS